MNDVLKNCLADYPTLSSKVKDYLKQVVHKACSHQGTFTASSSNLSTYGKL